MSALVALALCAAIDGDSIRCSGENIRLLGIDAPEFSCPRHRQCVEGDPQAAKDHLAALIRGRALTIERVGRDRYGRTLGVVYADGVNVSCLMVQARHAGYIERWDNGGRVARDC